MRGEVELSWSSTIDDGTLGFHVERSVHMNGPYDRLTTDLIPLTTASTYSYIDHEAPIGAHWYRVVAVDRNGSTEPHGPVPMLTSPVPVEFGLGQNVPNPANPATTIDYALPSATHVSLRIYDPRGVLVQSLVDRVEGPGELSVQWDGTDVRGQAAGSGVYFYELVAGERRETRKLVLLR